MITTVTLNPAIDKSIFIDGFQLGRVNRVNKSRLEAGGKGINVSKVLKVLGEDSIATGFLGGETGTWIDNCLKSKGIKTDFVVTNEETRTNIHIIDHKKSIITEINDQGKLLQDNYLKELQVKIKNLAKCSEVMVFSGSLPSEMPKTTYRDLLKIANGCGSKTILDTEGESLLYSIEAKPYMIKPNIHELENTLKVKFDNEVDIINHCKSFIDRGVTILVVSMGEEGALLITKDSVLKAEKIKVEVNNTVGAGDSMVATFAYGIKKGFDLEETFKMAIATATLSVSKEITFLHKEEIQSYMKKVRMTKLK